MRISGRLLTGVGVGAAVLTAAALGVRSCTGKEREGESSTGPTNQPLSAPALTETLPTPGPMFTPGLGNTPTPGAEWSCATIGDPGVPNAFRAIKRAGVPTIWEKPPYKYIPVGGSPRIVSKWSDLSLTHKGDQVCVEKGAGNIYSKHGTIFEAASVMKSSIDTKGKGFRTSSWKT